MADPDQHRRSLGGDAAMLVSGGGCGESYLKARTALNVFQAQERQLAIEKKKGLWLIVRELKPWYSAWPGRNVILGSHGLPACGL